MKLVVSQHFVIEHSFAIFLEMVYMHEVWDNTVQFN